MMAVSPQLWLPHDVEMAARASAAPLVQESPFLQFVTDCCEKECQKPKAQLVAAELERGGVVERFTDAMATEGAAPPETIEFKTDKGVWNRVNSCDKISVDGVEIAGDARLVWDCAEQFTGDCMDAEDLDYAAMFQLLGPGRGVGIQHEVDGETFYAIAETSAVRARKQGRRIVGWTWDRGGGRKKVKLGKDDVTDIWFPKAGRDHEAWSPWCPAARSLAFCAQIDRLLQLKIGEQIMIGGVIWWNLPKDPNSDDGIPQEVKNFKNHAERTKNRVETTTPYISGAKNEPKHIRLDSGMQAELLALKEAKLRDAARESPVEQGAFLEGEMSGNDWQASLRERAKWTSTVGPQRKRWLRTKWRWLMKPKLEELKANGDLKSDPSRWRYWFDPSQLQNRADNLSEMQKAGMQGHIGGAAIRRALGATEADALYWPDGRMFDDIDAFLCGQGKTREQIAELRRQYDRTNRPEPGTEVFERPPDRSEPTSMPSPRSQAALQVDLERVDPYAVLESPDPYSVLGEDPYRVLAA